MTWSKARRRSLASVLAVGAVVATLSVQATTAQADVTGAASAGPSLCGPPADTVPPIMTSLSLAKSSLDAKTSPVKQTVTVGAEDMGPQASGIQDVGVGLSGPDQQYAILDLRLTSGSATDGTWSGSTTISPGGVGGTWQVSVVNLSDRDGNEQGYDSRADDPTTLQLFPLADREFTVASTPKKVSAGTLKKIVISPAKIDTTKHSKKVKVSLTFKGASPSYVDFSLITSNGRIGGTGGTLHGSGSTWKGSFPIPRWAGDSTWKAQAYVTNEGKNNGKSISHNYNYSKLRALPGNADVQVTSGVDNSKPKLTSLSLSNTTVDTETGSASLTVTANATDTGSGIHHFDVLAYPKSRTAFGQADTKLIRQGSHYVGTLTFPVCSAPGTWNVEVDLTDNAGNYRDFRGSGLTAVKAPSTLTVVSHQGDLVPPQITTSTANAVADSITVKFSEPVKNVTTDNLTVFDTSAAGDPYSNPQSATSVTCYESDGTTQTDCSGTSSPVRSATLVFNSLPAGESYQLWANLDGTASQLTDLAGNPLSWSFYAANGKF